MLQRLEARLAEGVTTARAGAVLAAGAAAGAAAGMVAARVAGWREFTMVGPYPNLATAADAVQGMQLDTGQLGPMLSIHVATEYPHEVDDAARHLSTDTGSVVHTRSPHATSPQALSAPAATAAEISTVTPEAGEAPFIDAAEPRPIVSATSHPLSAPHGSPATFNTHTLPGSSNPAPLPVSPGFTSTSADTEHLPNTDTTPSLTNASGGFDNTFNPDMALHSHSGGSTYQDLARTLPLPDSSSDANSPPPGSDSERGPHWSDLDEAEDAVPLRANVTAGETDGERVGPSLASESGVPGPLASNSATTDTPDESEEEVEEDVDNGLEDDPPEPDPDDEAFLSL